MMQNVAKGRVILKEEKMGKKSNRQRRIVKRIFSAFIAASLVSGITMVPTVKKAYAAAQKYEFEDGTMAGQTAEAVYEGTKCVDLHDHSTGDSVTVKVDVEEAGMYDLTIRYYQPKDRGAKSQYVLVNGQTAATVNFAITDEWKELNIGTYKLNAGENTITVEAFWGWTYLDYLTVEKATLPELKGNATLSDKKATQSTQGLMNYLADIYGKHSLTGQQETCFGVNEDEFNYLTKTTGKSPAVRGFDFLATNPLFGWEDGTVSRMIKWVNEEGGIATASWHWFAPADMSTYNVGDKLPYEQSAFYVNGANSVTTNFDASKIKDHTSKEYQYVMLSLESIAEKLKLLQDADVPVIFRPLHEAGGSGTADCSGEWFWWANAGSEAYKELWRLMYTTLTEKYGLHNLIWEFNSYTYENSKDWYPGDDYVDIIAYDKYNATDKPNESALSSTFYSLVKMYEGKKMVSMAECDTIPSVENIMDESAFWLYACPWYGDHLMSAQKNAPETLNKIYNSDLFITKDELPDYKTYGFEKPTETTSESQSETATETESATETETVTETESQTETESGTETTSEEVTTELEVTTTEEVTTEPEMTTTEEVTTEPEVTTTEVITEPEVTTTEVITEPEVTTTEVITESEVTTTEDVTTEPEVTTTEVITEPEVTTEEVTTQIESTTELSTTKQEETTSAYVPVNEVRLNYYHISFKAGVKHRLQATVLPENATDKKVTWKSSNPEIVEIIDEDGTFLTKKPGEAFVQATVDGITRGCVIHVVEDETTESTKESTTETSTEPETTTKEETTTQTETSTKPEVTTKEEATTQAETSTEPEVTTKEETTTQAETSTEPEITTKEETTTQAETSTEPEATTKEETTTQAETTSSSSQSGVQTPTSSTNPTENVEETKKNTSVAPAGKKKSIKKPAKVIVVKKKTGKSGKVTFIWKKQKNTTGYKIYCYRASKSKGKYKLYKTVKKNQVTISRLKKGKTYRFKICAYVKQGTAMKTGAFSRIQIIRIK